MTEWDVLNQKLGVSWGHEVVSDEHSEHLLQLNDKDAVSREYQKEIERGRLVPSSASIFKSRCPADSAFHYSPLQKPFYYILRHDEPAYPGPYMM